MKLTVVKPKASLTVGTADSASISGLGIGDGTPEHERDSLRNLGRVRLMNQEVRARDTQTFSSEKSMSNRVRTLVQIDGETRQSRSVSFHCSVHCRASLSLEPPTSPGCASKCVTIANSWRKIGGGCGGLPYCSKGRLCHL